MIKDLVSIIVLNWNGIGLTEKCLKAVKKETKHRPYELILVDNGSDEANVNRLKELKKLGFIDRLIENEKNTGFSFANNQGFDAAKGDYVFMLNNDTLPRKGWLGSVLRVLKENPDAAAVGCKLVDLKPFKEKEFELRPDRVVTTTCGAAMLIRKSALKKIGYLDAKHFSPIYGEETDWCYRARLKGFKVMETDKAIVVHIGSHDTKKGRGRESAFELMNTYRLKARLYNLTIPQFWGHVPGLGLIFVNAAKDGLLPSLLKTYRNNARNAKEILRERKKRKARLF